jgi:UDP-glucose 4-epimerase
VEATQSASCIAITGLDTLAGRGIAERLLAQPDPPTLIGIDRQVPRVLRHRIKVHALDLTDPVADGRFADILSKEGCDSVIHAAFFQKRTADRSYAHELEVIGSLHVMNGAAAANVQRLVVTSTARVYGAHVDNPGFLDEDSPLRGHAGAPEVEDLVEMERLLGTFARRHPQISVVVLRPCMVVGPRADSQAVRRGPFNLAGEGVLPLSTLLKLGGKSRRRIPHPLLYRLDYARALWIGGATPAGFYDYLRFPWVVDCERATRELGFHPEYSTKEAWMSFVVSRRLRDYR